MSGATKVEGYPFPLTSDFADVQDAYRLAAAVDSDLRAKQAPFRAFEGRPSFIARKVGNGSGFLSGSQRMTFDAVDWDNTGGALVGALSWVQPFAQQPSWWLFGATLLVNPVTTPVVGDLCLGDIGVTTSDQVTGVVSTSHFYQRNDESNTGGDWINLFAMASAYQGSASLTLRLNGSTQKSVRDGSRFWGMYLGPVV